MNEEILRVPDIDSSALLKHWKVGDEMTQGDGTKFWIGQIAIELTANQNPFGYKIHFYDIDGKHRGDITALSYQVN